MTGDVMKKIGKLRASPRFAVVSLLGRILYLPGHIAPDARGLRACEDVTRALEESGAHGANVLLVNYTLHAAGPERDAAPEEMALVRAQFASLRTMAEPVSSFAGWIGDVYGEEEEQA